MGLPTDDTVILVENNDTCINLKFLLLFFESISGLKINFAKSEVLVMGTSNDEAVRVANLLNCQLGSFPFKYLGIPISSSEVPKKDFAPTVLKVANRVMQWRGRYNSVAGKVGKVLLTNSCLSSLPMFLMGFYRLPEGIHEGFNKHRSGFYWNSADNKKKYRLVKWKIICRPKSHGGLSIIDTSIMNI